MEPAGDLLERLRLGRESVLAFIAPRIPGDDHQAERDPRRRQVQ